MELADFMDKLSVVVPTYNEREGIENLIKKLSDVFRKNRIAGEIIIVDDNSPDRTWEAVQKIGKKQKNVRLLRRSGKLGLSSAVLEGIKISKNQVVAVMDADMSHPPEKLPEMLKGIKDGADIAIGSRYVKGGKIEGWPAFRLIGSKGATMVARLFTKAHDPMSGFFIIKKECLEGREFDPKGFKICLELLVKSKCRMVKEVPIKFINRIEGKSKASAKEAIYFLRNIRGYVKYFPESRRKIKII